jgi:hypothetical protein
VFLSRLSSQQIVSLSIGMHLFKFIFTKEACFLDIMLQSLSRAAGYVEKNRDVYGFEKMLEEDPGKISDQRHMEL